MICAISSSAAMSVALESNRYDGLETGGLLLGRKLPDGIRVVMRVTNGGPNAKRYATSFSPDIDYLNACIRSAEREGLAFLGEWHLHPGSLSVPSGGDEGTIRETMEYAKLDSFEALIVNVEENSPPRLFAYRYDSSHTRFPVKVKVVDDEEAEKMMPWFDTQEGRERLKLDSLTMRARFQAFKMLRQGDQVWWTGEHAGHKVQLVYPADFPGSPILVEIAPPVEGLQDEPKVKHAILAAEIAILRIDRLGLAPAMPQAPVTPTAAGQWYDSREGQEELHKLDEFLRREFRPVTTHRLPGGEIAFSCGVRQSVDSDLILVFPRDFPDHKPEASGRIGKETVTLELYPQGKWQGKQSLEVMVEDALAKLREKEKLLNRSRGWKWRVFGRSHD